MNCAVLVTCESMAYFSIAVNMIIYLTTVLDEGVATSVKNVNYWIGTSCVLPLLGGFIADVYCGRYKMVLVSSAIYISVSFKILCAHCITVIVSRFFHQLSFHAFITSFLVEYFFFRFCYH